MVIGGNLKLEDLPPVFDMTTVAHAKQLFFSSPYYAVVGASKDQSKWGTKVLQWYKQRGKSVIPLHPVEDELGGVPSVRSLSDLPFPTETSVSIITPAKITILLVQQAKELGIPAVWIQPGAADPAVIAYIKANDLTEKIVYGGPCVLVEGDDIIKSLL